MVHRSSVGTGALIPDRLRRYFPLNGGRRPSPEESEQGHRGIAAARAALEAVESRGPRPPQVSEQLDPEQVACARRGIAKARRALQVGADPTD
jgi:hypothetical protein